MTTFLSSFFLNTLLWEGFLGGLVVKNLPAIAGDVRDAGSIPGSGRSPGEEDHLSPLGWIGWISLHSDLL